MVTPSRRAGYRPGEISAVGEGIYRRRLRAHLDTPENLGKLLLIDIESGDFEVTDDQNELDAFERLHQRRPDAVVYTLRIGYVATESVFRSGCIDDLAA